MTEVKTERLALKPLVAENAEAYAVMRDHPEVTKWLLPLQGDPVEAARGTIGRFAQQWSERGYAPWAVWREGRLIGHCGLNYVPEFEATEVLWALHPDFWGGGYATEAARAALRFGFDDVGLAMIFAITKPDNMASQAVVKRLGLEYRRNVTYRGFEARFFDIDRATWQNSRTTSS